MGRATASVLAIVMLGLLATDGIVCPDGCTEPGHAAALASGPDAQDPGDSCCVLCAGTIPVPEAATPLPLAAIVAPDYPLPRHSPAAILTPRIDHPPRVC